MDNYYFVFLSVINFKICKLQYFSIYIHIDNIIIDYIMENTLIKIIVFPDNLIEYSLFLRLMMFLMDIVRNK